MTLFRLLAVVGALFIAIAPAYAVRTQTWKQTTTEDFRAGTLHNIVATSHGQLRLSRQSESLLPKEKHFDAIQAIVPSPDGGIVFGTFPDAEVLQLKDGALSSLHKFDNETITSLAYDTSGRLLVGIGGESGKVVRLGKPADTPETVFEEAGVSYIWAIVPDADKLLLATGPTGGVYEVDAQGKHKLLAQLGADNVLCLALDHDGQVYAGTDQHGLVYRIDRKTDKPYVLLDAAEAEVSALCFDAKGNLLAATSDATETEQPPPENPAQGKPEKREPAAAISSKKPEAPKLPEERPGDAIPRTTALPPAQEEAPPGGTTRPAEPAPAAGQPGSAAPSTAGNAVYQIDPQGFTTELFRGPVIIYGMVIVGDSIFLATGADGGVYELRPSTEETTVIARTDAPDVTAIVKTKDGSLLLGTSNAGQVLKLSPTAASEGSYESEVLDAEVVSAFGTVHLIGTMPGGSKISISARTGNVSEPDAQGWTDWSDPLPATEYTHLTAKPARFLQYRLTFTAGANHESPTVDEVTTSYQKPNVAPTISAVIVTPADDPLNPGNMTIAWEAADANDDKLQFGVYVRQIGKPAWIELAKDITEVTHTWPAKGTADGQYEVKVIASDAASNPPGQGKEASRVSETVLFDTAPPAIGDIKTTVSADVATITLRAVDRTGTIASVDYTIDRIDHWQRSLPNDTIADSPEERYTLSVPGLTKGQHTVLVKASDERGNASLETIELNVP